MNLKQLIDEFVTVLEIDVRHLEFTLSSLDSLRSAVIKREEVELKKLLPKISAEIEKYRQVESLRASLRNRIAPLIGLNIADFNLTNLRTKVSPEQSSQIAEKQNKLNDLVSSLKSEHASTARFLQDCSRINRSFLQMLIGNSEQETYTRSGKMAYQSDTTKINLVNMKF